MSMNSLTAANAEYLGILDDVQSMSSEAAVDHLLSIVQNLTHSLQRGQAGTDLAIELPGSEARLFNILQAHNGKLVSVDQLVTAMYYDRHADEWPDAPTDTMRVILHRLKRRLASTSWSIRNVHGQGYAMVSCGVIA